MTSVQKGTISCWSSNKIVRSMKTRTEPRFQRIKKAFKLYKHKVLWTLICVFVLVLLTCFKYDAWDLALQLLLAVTSTLLIFIIIDSVKQEIEEEEHDKYIKEVVWDALKMENRLLKLYKKEAIEDVMQNCIGHFCPHLKEAYVDYILKNLNVFRKDFAYDVAIKKNNTDFNSIYISHILSYTRFFLIEELDKDVVMECYFTIKTGELDKTMKNNSLFFREELLYPPLLEKIKKTTEPGDLIDLLNVKFYLGENNDCVDKSRIDVVRDEYGISFRTAVDKCYLTQNEVNYGGNYISYHGKVECKYPAYVDNKFYCIFSNPTIGNTSFSITFFDDIVKDVNEVDKITMLSNTKYTISSVPDHNKIEFSTAQAIFPRSGVLVQWDTKVKI